MINIIAPTQFNTIPWKNGKGQTTELAINLGGTLDAFDWRLSMARVCEDGPFSDFSGYQRNLVLIEGNGIRLEHDETAFDDLSAILSLAKFDGACQTIGKLKAGPIVDFNVISNSKTYKVNVNTYNERQRVNLPSGQLCFVYCLDAEADLLPQMLHLPALHLLHVPAEENEGLAVKGQSMIVVCLEALNG